jgi:hypothetical protein
MRAWLGTFNITEEGTLAYDEKVILFCGANAKTNFHILEHIINVPLIPHIAHSNDIFAFAQRKLNEL